MTEVWDLSGITDMLSLPPEVAGESRGPRGVLPKRWTAIPDGCSCCGRKRTVLSTDENVKRFKRSGECQRCQDPDWRESL